MSRLASSPTCSPPQVGGGSTAGGPRGTSGCRQTTGPRFRRSSGTGPIRVADATVPWGARGVQRHPPSWSGARGSFAEAILAEPRSALAQGLLQSEVAPEIRVRHGVVHSSAVAYSQSATRDSEPLEDASGELDIELPRRDEICITWRLRHR